MVPCLEIRPVPVKRFKKPKRGVLSRLTRRGKKALIRAETKSQQKSRPVKIEGDDYADVYGDDDGFENGEYREVAMRSGQILRLRADQDHQAEVAERIKNLSKSTGGDIADDETDALVQRLSESGDLAPIANLLKAAETKQLSFGQLASTSPPKKPWPPWYLTNGLITAILPFGDTYPTWRDTHLAPDQQFLQHQTVRG